MTCLHRHLSAIPGGRFACSDTLNCGSVFTLTTDSVAPSHAVKVLAAHLADADERIAMARSKASTQARMASLRHRDQEERNWLDVVNLLDGKP